MTAGAFSFPHKLIRAAQADPKKAAVLGVLVVVLGLLQVRRMTAGGPAAGPRSAAASVAAEADNASAARARALDAADAAAAMSEWKAAPVAPLGRNLFATNLDYFPRDGSRPLNPQGSNEGFWEEVAKSLSTQADQKKQKQILIENLQLQAEKLRLQTTVMGAKPMAVINGDMVGEGDVVAAGSGEARAEFRVLKIEARRIIVEREGIRLEIPMK